MAAEANNQHRPVLLPVSKQPPAMVPMEYRPQARKGLVSAIATASQNILNNQNAVLPLPAPSSISQIRRRPGPGSPDALNRLQSLGPLNNRQHLRHAGPQSVALFPGTTGIQGATNVTPLPVSHERSNLSQSPNLQGKANRPQPSSLQNVFISPQAALSQTRLLPPKPSGGSIVPGCFQPAQDPMQPPTAQRRSHQTLAGLSTPTMVQTASAPTSPASQYEGRSNPSPLIGNRAVASPPLTRRHQNTASKPQDLRQRSENGPIGRTNVPLSTDTNPSLRYDATPVQQHTGSHRDRTVQNNMDHLQKSKAKERNVPAQMNKPPPQYTPNHLPLTTQPGVGPKQPQDTQPVVRKPVTTGQKQLEQPQRATQAQAQKYQKEQARIQAKMEGNRNALLGKQMVEEQKASSKLQHEVRTMQRTAQKDHRIAQKDHQSAQKDQHSIHKEHRKAQKDHKSGVKGRTISSKVPQVVIEDHRIIETHNHTTQQSPHDSDTDSTSHSSDSEASCVSSLDENDHLENLDPSDEVGPNEGVDSDVQSNLVSPSGQGEQIAWQSDNQQNPVVEWEADPPQQELQHVDPGYYGEPEQPDYAHAQHQWNPEYQPQEYEQSNQGYQHEPEAYTYDQWPQDYSQQDHQDAAQWHYDQPQHQISGHWDQERVQSPEPSHNAAGYAAGAGAAVGVLGGAALAAECLPHQSDDQSDSRGDYEGDDENNFEMMNRLPETVDAEEQESDSENDSCDYCCSWDCCGGICDSDEGYCDDDCGLCSCFGCCSGNENDQEQDDDCGLCSCFGCCSGSESDDEEEGCGCVVM